MGWFSSIVIGLITAALGCVGAGLVATRCVRWYRISSFEGASGYYVVAIALLGIVVGLVVGIVCARIVAGWDAPGFPKGLGVAAGSMGGLVLVAGLLARLGADLAPEIDGQSLELAIEVRGPKDFTVPAADDKYGSFASVYVPRGRSQPNGELRLKEATQSDGRWIVPSTVPLRTSVRDKYLRVYFNKEHDPMFSLRLRGRPAAKDFEWSSWVESGWNVGQAEPAPDQKFTMRFRVQKVPLPPPEPTQEEIDAKEAAADQARFDAVAPTAPITDWLPYTRYGAPEERRAIAIKHMLARETFVAELTALMVSGDAEVAAEAMRLVEHLPQPFFALNSPVAEVGRGIAGLIREVNASKPEDDPSYLRFVEVSTRFSSWMTAVRTLREKSGGDFTLELGEILTLSRVREDSHSMRVDVRRVASYYMHTWTGLAPLAGDPKPR